MSTMSLASLKVNKCSKVSPNMIWGETHTVSIMICRIKMCRFCTLFDFFYMMDCHYYTLVYSDCRSHLCCFQYKILDTSSSLCRQTSWDFRKFLVTLLMQHTCHTVYQYMLILVAIQLSADILLRTLLQHIIEIALMIILAKKVSLMEKKQSNDPDKKATEWSQILSSWWIIF